MSETVRSVLDIGNKVTTLNETVSPHANVFNFSPSPNEGLHPGFHC